MTARSPTPTLCQGGGSDIQATSPRSPKHKLAPAPPLLPPHSPTGQTEGQATYFLQWGHPRDSLAHPWATLVVLQLLERLTACLHHREGLTKAHRL